MEFFYKFIESFFNLANTMSIYIMVGLFVAGVLKQLLPSNFVAKHLGKNSSYSVIKATILGIPLPVCSCSVIPLAQSLKKEGASKGAVQSFLISTPITGVDSILATFSFFGLVFTVFRVVSSVIIAIIIGLLQNIVEKKEQQKEQKSSFQTAPKFSLNQNLNTPKNLNFSTQKATPSCCATNMANNSKKGSFFINAIKYAYGILFKDMAKALLVGLLIGALFMTFVPQEYSKLLFENQFLTYFTILAFAIPLYTCVTASLPIAAAFMLQGMSGGAAFIFLSAGPATSIVTMSVVYKMLGKTSLIVYVVSIAVLSLIFGYVYDTFFPKLDILNSVHTHEEQHIIPTVIMLLLIVYHLLKDRLFSKKEVKSSCCA